MFDEGDNFYMQYPFAAHFEADGTAFLDFVPIDGVLFSRECFDKNFVSSSAVCDGCAKLETLTCVKNLIERASRSYKDDLTLTTVKNKYLNCGQMIEKIEYQEKKSEITSGKFQQYEESQSFTEKNCNASSFLDGTC